MLGLQVDRGIFAVPAPLGLIRDFLTLAEIAESSPLNSGDVHENIVAPTIGLNETIAFLAIIPFNCTARHVVLQTK